jgi:ribosomal-protein-alanine N-acetyltransferase
MSLENVSFKCATAEDIDAMDGLNRMSLPENYPISDWQVYVDRMSRHCFVAYDGDVLIGYTLGSCMRNATHPWTLEGSIDSIAVHPHYRNQKPGYELLSRTVDSLEIASNITIEVRSSNKIAQKLYRSLNFIEMKLEEGFYDDGEDALHMSCVPKAKQTAMGPLFKTFSDQRVCLVVRYQGVS